MEGVRLIKDKNVKCRGEGWALREKEKGEMKEKVHRRGS